MNASARWLPRNPAAPDTNTFMLESARATQYRGNRSEKNADIQPERPLLDVLPVEEYHILEIENFAPPAHLPESGNSRLRIEPSEMVILVLAEIRLEEGTRPDQRHVSDEHIEDLRQLVQTPASQSPPETGRPWVILDLEEANIA